jgi:hypothetical protein
MHENSIVIHNIFTDLLACVYRVAGDEHEPLVVAIEQEFRLSGKHWGIERDIDFANVIVDASEREA